MTTIGATWRQVRDQFRTAGISTATLDAQLLAQQVFSVDTLGLAVKERDMANAHQIEGLNALAARRLSGEPVARILGTKEFFGLDFGLNADTLVPRPETEMVVEMALTLLSQMAADPDTAFRVLDLGTGSGCIAISLLTARASLTATAVDISAEALAQAVANAHMHDVADRFEPLCGSWFDPLDEGAKFDIIVSNPPYITSDVMTMLDTEVRAFDPERALDGGEDGLEAYRVIASHAGKFLNPTGSVVVEIGYDQGKSVSRIFDESGLTNVEIYQDLAGLDRMIVAKR